MLAFAIMAGADAAPELRGWLTARLAAQGLALAEGGLLRAVDGGRVVARWAPGDAELLARPWHVAESPCPFVPAFAGHLCVAPADGAAAISRDVARTIARIGRGVVARLDDDRATATVALRSIELEGATTADGLEGGALLLERDPRTRYADDVLDRLAAAAAARGLRTSLRWRRDRANPIELVRVQPFGADQLYPPVWGAGGTSIDPLRALHGLTVELWLHALDGLDVPGFLASPTEP